MKTNLMKSILHLKDDTEYQIPLRETEKDNRAEVGTTEAQQNLETSKEEAKQAKAAVAQSQDELHDAQKSKNDKIDQLKADSAATKEAKKKTGDDALKGLKDETKNPEPSNTENSSNDTTTEGVPPADTAKAALDEMKKLASQEGVIHPSLFISNFSKILGLMERAMQLQVKESGSATEESGSVTKEAPKTAEKTETTEKTEPPAEGKQGELNGNSNSNNRS